MTVVGLLAEDVVLRRIEELLVLVFASGAFGFQRGPGEGRLLRRIVLDGLLVDGALVEADAAAHAVFHIDLDLELQAIHLRNRVFRREGGGSLRQVFDLEQLGANCSVRAAGGADSALDTG